MAYILIWSESIGERYEWKKTQKVFQKILYVLGLDSIIVFDLILAMNYFKLVSKSAVSSFLQKTRTKKGCEYYLFNN